MYTSISCPLTNLGTRRLWSCWERPGPTSPGTSWRKQEQNCAGEVHKKHVFKQLHTYSHRFLAIHSNPSYIVDTGTTSCPAVTQTVGMPPGSIALDLFCISSVGKYTTLWPAPVIYLPETLDWFCQDSSTLQFQKHAFCKAWWARLVSLSR